MKQFTAILSFIFMWFFVSIICGVVLILLFPSDGIIRIGLAADDWRTWPSAVLGVLAGIHSYKAALNPKSKPKGRTNDGGRGNGGDVGNGHHGHDDGDSNGNGSNGNGGNGGGNGGGGNGGGGD